MIVGEINGVVSLNLQFNHRVQSSLVPDGGSRGGIGRCAERRAGKRDSIPPSAPVQPVLS